MLAFAAFDLTGWSTVALAAVTLVSVVLGYRALRQTRAEMLLSRHEVEESHRPVLIPVIASVRHYEGEGPLPRGAATPFHARGADGVALTVRNVGSGPALDIVASVQLRDPDGHSTAEGGVNSGPSQLTGIGAGESEAVYLPIGSPINPFEDLPCFQLELRYLDQAGKGWVTEGLYLSRRATGGMATFADLEVNPARRPAPNEGRKLWQLRLLRSNG